MDLVYGLDMDELHPYEDFRDILHELGYKPKDKLNIIICNIENYEEDTDLAYDVCNALTYSASEYSDTYMEYESMNHKEEERLNQLLNEAVKTFQKEFNCEPEFYDIVSHEFQDIVIIDDEYNFKII